MITPTVAEGRTRATVGFHYHAPGEGNATSRASKRHQDRGPRTGNAGTFFLFAGLSIVALAYFQRQVPETKNRSLQDIERDLDRPESRDDLLAPGADDTSRHSIEDCSHSEGGEAACPPGLKTRVSTPRS